LEIIVNEINKTLNKNDLNQQDVQINLNENQPINSLQNQPINSLQNQPINSLENNNLKINSNEINTKLIGWSCAELNHLILKNPKLVIFDVRVFKEYVQGHIGFFILI
jgi:hypothetical protein